MEEATFINATVVDGTGAEPFQADVVVSDGRIADVASPGTASRGAVIDCKGLLLAPGFIDIHSHSDLTLLLDPRASSSIYQGVTLEVIGNCGHGCAPLRDIAVARSAIYGPIPPPGFFDWTTMAGFLDRLERAEPAVNVVALVPNGQLRLSRVGRSQGPASDDELAGMCRDLEASLEAGACGLSSGLEYVQERGCTPDQMDRLCAIVASRGGLYATHTRYRDDRALEAIDEAIGTARRTGVRLQISHITPRGGMADTEASLRRVDDAIAEGIDVGFDMHTRLFGFTHLKNLLPMWALEGSPLDIRRRLRDPQALEKIRSHPNLISGIGDWSRVVLDDSMSFSDYNGLTFDVIAARMKTTVFDAAIRVLLGDVEQIQRPMVLLKTYSEPVLRTTYQHAGCMPGSDATALAPDGSLAGEKFHGAYTWASWFLRRMVRETNALTVPDAIRRLTSLPAERLRLSRRGRIARGCEADVVVLDWARYRDLGTVQDPSKLAQGVEHVWVNGVPTLSNGRPTGRRAGKLLRY